MAKVKILIDTDVFIDYLNRGFLGRIFENKQFQIYYSIVTKKELLSKPGLRDNEKKAILSILRQHRLVPLKPRITIIYSELRRKYPAIEKEDALIAASALVLRIPFLTRNSKHFKMIKGLTLFIGSPHPL